MTGSAIVLTRLILDRRKPKEPPLARLRRWLTWKLCVVIALGVLVGSGAFTFNHANGLAYLSNNPTACINCHIMRDQFDGWQKSTHHHVAVCNDCHVPKDPIRKWLVKAENGYAHSRAFTFEDFHEPIRMRPVSRQVVLDNCVQCHTDITSHMALGAGRQRADCLHCHASVGHGPTR